MISGKCDIIHFHRMPNSISNKALFHDLFRKRCKNAQQHKKKEKASTMLPPLGHLYEDNVKASFLAYGPLFLYV